MNKRWVIFDFDGTLVDSKEVILGIMNTLAEKYGRKRISVEEFEEILDNPGLGLLFRYRIWPWQAFSLVREGKALFKKKLGEVKFFPGALDAIKRLKARYNIGVFTYNNVENVKRIFEREGEKNILDIVVSTGRIRGKARGLKKIISDLKVSKSEIIYVGDETGDIEACRKVGIKVIAVSWGFSRRDSLKSKGPDYLVDGFNELLELLISI